MDSLTLGGKERLKIHCCFEYRIMWVHLNHLSKFIMIKSQIMFAPHLQLDGSTDGEDLQKH